MALMKFREPNQVLWQGVRPAHDGTQVLKRALASNNIAIVYTVPAASTFYLCHAVIGYSGMAAGLATSEIQNAVPAREINIFYDMMLAASEGVTKHAFFWPPIEMLTGWRVTVSSNAVGLDVHLNIFGWVE